MIWRLLICLVVVSPLCIHGEYPDLKRILKFIQRRYTPDKYDVDLGRPSLPGDTLIKPTSTMLKSQTGYQRHKKNLKYRVYGNPASVGIAYGDSNYPGPRSRVLYSSFRRNKQADVLLNSLLVQAIRNIQAASKKKPAHVLVIEVTPKRTQSLPSGELMSEEIADLDDGYFNNVDFRRKKPPPSKRKSPFHKRLGQYVDPNTVPPEEEESEEVEKNPGNPYTVHRSKYLQNWLFNHEMTGDHMNISPYAPYFNTMGPSPGEIFFARKWWYFNQDDYKPMTK